MKRILVFLVILVIATFLTACISNKTKAGTDVVTGNAASMDGTSGTPAGKVLVVYYSATERTKIAAEAIAAATQGELFELVPQQPYTAADLNYNNKDSRVSREHDDPAGRHVELVKDTVDNFADYGTVFIGYPIWWGDASWVIDDFVKHNNFSGKTVIPFATAYSSPLGDSGNHLAAMAGTGNWRDGICFDRAMTTEKVADWAESLGIN